MNKKKLDIKLGDKNKNQTSTKEIVPLEISVNMITCTLCKKGFVIYQPKYSTLESGNTEYFLEPLEQTVFCPFCGK